LTFKNPSKDALAFLPGSTWSDGRNKLWQELRDKYDYYVFIDDDLQFLKPKVAFSPLATYASHKFLYRGHLREAYELATPEYFFKRLESHLATFRPEILSALGLADSVSLLDMAAMRNNSYVRRLGFFDAQFTVFSKYAASKLLPYDTKISGWWSSQIPIFLYAHQVFASKALAISDIAVINTVASGGYVPNYSGLQDCQTMLSAITAATGKDYNHVYRSDTAVNNFYGKQAILKKIPTPDSTEDYAVNYSASLKGLENLLHPNVAFD
jgi:hypothetical protein